MKYEIPIKNKSGIRSKKTNKMLFGICCDTPEESWKFLKSKLGDIATESRFGFGRWKEKDLIDWKEQRIKHEECLAVKKELREKENKEINEFIKFIKNNQQRLTDKDNRKERFDKIYKESRPYHGQMKGLKLMLQRWIEICEEE